MHDVGVTAAAAHAAHHASASTVKGSGETRVRRQGCSGGRVLPEVTYGKLQTLGRRCINVIQMFSVY